MGFEGSQAADGGIEQVSAPGGRRLGAAFLVGALATCLLVGLVVGALVFEIRIDPSAEPGTIHAFGQTYHRYQPCCEWGETYFGRGPVSLASAQEAYGPTFQLIVVRLAGPPLGWLGAADAVTGRGGPPGQAPSLILLQEGPDLYYPYHTGDGMTP